MPAGYYRQEIPACPSYGFETSKEFNTRVNELVSGRENRNAAWMYGRHRVAVSWYNVLQEDIDGLGAFFYSMRGRLYAFLQRDWVDFYADQEFIGTGDGVATSFQLGKYYTVGPGYFRPIYALDGDTLQVFVDGVLVDPADYTADLDRGKIVFDTPPALDALVSWSGEFWLWVRFDSDSLPVQVVDASDGRYVFSGAITMLEVPPPPVEG